MRALGIQPLSPSRTVGKRAVEIETMALSSVYSIGTRACLFTMVQKQVNSVVIWLTLYGTFGAQAYIQDHGMVALALTSGMALWVLITIIHINKNEFQ